MLRLVSLLLVCACTTNTAPLEPVTVSAAISLTEVLRELGRAYEAEKGGTIVLNFAASNVLARQIVNGAPVDVFISADEAQMVVVEKAGMVLPGTRVPLVGNQLAIIVRSDRADPPDSLAALTSPGIRRIAIGNPEAVPAGVYARQHLERLGLWNSLRDKVLPAGSVRAVLATVANGAADVGIVYATDARTSAAVRVTTVLSGPDAPHIVYPAAVISSSTKREAAQAFLAFLRTAAASAIFSRYGFQAFGSVP